MPQAVTERVFAATPFFTGRTLVAPFQMATQVTDTILVRWVVGHIDGFVAGVTTVQIDIVIRQLTPSGEIVHTRQVFTLPDDYTSGEFSIGLRDGFLLAFVVANSGDAVRVGQLFLSAALVRPQGGVSMALAALVQGFPARRLYLAWPGSPLDSTKDAPWYPVTREIAAAGAGLEWSFLSPQVVEMAPTCITAVFGASAAVANRQLSLIIQPNALPVSWLARRTFAITAGQIVRVTWAIGTPGLPQAGEIEFVDALPAEAVWGPVAAIRSSTTNLQALDQYTDVVFQLRERIRTVI